jgi:outer membrane lipase/esterase
MIRRLCIGLCLALPVLGFAQWNRMVCFGDSLSDVGNTNSVTFGFAPGSGYYQGRFSNGPVWVENLAPLLSVPVPVRSTNGGRNYAYGGAKTGSGFTSLVIRNMSNQVDQFLGASNPTNTDVITVWIAANDYLDGTPNYTTIAQRVASDITKLYNRGGRTFVVPNLPLLGYTPRYLGTADEASKNSITQQYNAALETQLVALDAMPGIRIVRMDTAKLIDRIRTNSLAYGFFNVTAQAKGLGGIDADTYLFWDDVHPTRRAHALLAAYAADSVRFVTSQVTTRSRFGDSLPDMRNP